VITAVISTFFQIFFQDLSSVLLPIAKQPFSSLAIDFQADLCQTVTIPLRNIQCRLGKQLKCIFGLVFKVMRNDFEKATVKRQPEVPTITNLSPHHLILFYLCLLESRLSQIFL
jgi:hypothetical protein